MSDVVCREQMGLNKLLGERHSCVADSIVFKGAARQKLLSAAGDG